MNVILPPALAEQVEWAVRSGLYFSKAEYIRHLIRQDLLRNGSLGEKSNIYLKHHRPIRRHKPRSLKKTLRPEYLRREVEEMLEMFEGLPVTDSDELADGYKGKSRELPRKYTLKKPEAKLNEPDDEGSCENDE